jgi:hypothetical protein
MSITEITGLAVEVVAVHALLALGLTMTDSNAGRHSLRSSGSGLPNRRCDRPKMFRCPRIKALYLIAQKKIARSSDGAGRQGGKPFWISKERLEGKTEIRQMTAHLVLASYRRLGEAALHSL